MIFERKIQITKQISSKYIQENNKEDTKQNIRNEKVNTFINFLCFNYLLLIMLLQLFPFFSLCPPPPSIPHTLRQFSHHCSCPWVMHIGSLFTPFPVLYFTSPWLFCNYLFLLVNPLTSSPIPPHSPPIWQSSKLSPYPWFCLCSCLLSLFFRFNSW